MNDASPEPPMEPGDPATVARHRRVLKWVLLGFLLVNVGVLLVVFLGNRRP